MNKTENIENDTIQDQQTQQRSSRVKKVLGEEITQEEIQSGELDQLELLQQAYKGATMEMHSIEVIRPIIKDKAFKNLLFQHYNGYKTLSKEIELEAASQGYDLRPANIINKAIAFGSVLFGTISDKTNSKLAEIMIQNMNMGILNLVRVINSINADLEIDQTFSDKLMNMYQQNIEALKVHL